VKYYLIAGERSGDLHGANLIKAIRARNSEATFRGFGGDEMQAAGMEVAVHYRHLAGMGFVSLAGSLFRIFRFIAFCKKDILSFKPHAIILIDYGGFNMKIASFAKKRGFTVFYYIPPKVWAWYQSRARKLKATVNKMLVILPFESEFYQKYDLKVDYVGNPVLDAIKVFKPDRNFRFRHNLKTTAKLVALLPGSREIELKRIVPLMADVTKLNPSVQFAVATVSNLAPSLYRDLKNIPNVVFVEEDTYNLLAHADAAIVTSGTATLETAIFKVPQVVVYKTSSIEYRIASALVKVKYISLVNLIGGRPVVKELIQAEATVAHIHQELDRLLNDVDYIMAMKAGYDNVYRTLDIGSASENAARLIHQFERKEKAADLGYL
jgi:lipid-A-disaccharide synthase